MDDRHRTCGLQHPNAGCARRATRTTRPTRHNAVDADEDEVSRTIARVLRGIDPRVSTNGDEDDGEDDDEDDARNVVGDLDGRSLRTARGNVRADDAGRRGQRGGYAQVGGV